MFKKIDKLPNMINSKSIEEVRILTDSYFLDKDGRHHFFSISDGQVVDTSRDAHEMIKMYIEDKLFCISIWFKKLKVSETISRGKIVLKGFIPLYATGHYYIHEIVMK